MANRRSATTMHLLAYQHEFHETTMQQYAALAVKAEELLDASDEIRTSKLLTADGRLDAKTKLIQKARAELLPALEKTVRDHDVRLEALTRDAIPKRQKDQLQHSLEAEIRSVLRGQDKLENFNTLQDAIKDGDELTITAIMDAPPFFKLLTPENRRTAMELRLQKSPNGDEIARVKHSRSVHLAVLQAVQSDIASVETGGVTPGPLVQSSADGRAIEEMAR